MTPNHAATSGTPVSSRSTASLALHRAMVTLAIVLIIHVAAFGQTKGTFQAGINYSAGPATVPSNTGFLIGGILTLEAHAGDFNGDGKPDVVVAAGCNDPDPNSYGIPGCPASGYPVVVYLSNGDGTFQTGIMSGGPASSLRSIAVGDFNGDGKLDVVAASDCLSSPDCSSGSMVVLLGKGDGTFSQAAYYELGGIVSQHYTLAVGDFNSDGKLDVVAGIACYNIPVNGCSVGAVEIFLGNGDGTLASPAIYSTVGNSALYPVVGDFNGDGTLDVIAGSSFAPNDNSHSSLTVLLGAGDGTFSETVTPLTFFSMTGIVRGDFNSDGILDLAIAAQNGVQVLNGNGDATFQNPVSFGVSAVITSIVAADMNGDGKADLVVGNGGLVNSATLLLNDGNGNFNNISAFTLGGFDDSSVVVADFNSDGRNDIVLASFLAEDSSGGSDGTLSVLLGNGDGTVRSARYISEGPDIPRPAVAAADFNVDGFQDLIYPSGCGAGASCTPSGFTLLLSDGAGGYQAPLAFTAPVKQSRFLAVDDFNGDGKLDVAVFNDCNADCSANSVSIFLNTGNGTFSDPVVYDTVGVVPFTIITGDFNGDGKKDIAVLHECDLTSNCEGLIGIFLGNGDGTFQPEVTTVAAISNTYVSWWIAGADLNGDGRTDLVVAQNPNSQTDPFAGSAQILLSKGDGTFSFGQSYPSGGGRSAFGGGEGLTVSTGDVNGDGKPDVVIGNSCEPVVRGQVAYDVNCANGSVGVLLGNGDGTFQVAPSQIVTDGNLWGIALADVNDDGKLDEIASTSTGIMVSIGNGDGTFQAPTIYAALQVDQNVQLAIADLNGDGGLDIMQPGINGQLAVLYNQGFTNPRPVVTLQSSLNPSTYAQLVMFTATVTSTSGTPTGTVTFMDGSATLGSATLANGSASFRVSTLVAGAHSITGMYSGDTNHSGSTSAALQQVVNQATTTAALTSSANPSYPNQTVGITATVLPQFGGTATGTVVFKQGTTVLGTLPLSSGLATYQTTYTTTGTHSITASYAGDNNFLGSTSAVLKQVVKLLPAATTARVTTSHSPSFINQPVTFTATVTSTYGPIPDGELVTFKDGTVLLASVPLSGGVAIYTISALSAKTHTIKASYAGDATFKPSTGSVQQVVSLYSTTTALTSSLNPSAFNQAVTFTATVTTTAPSSPTGKVTFRNGTTAIGTVTVDGSGVATLTKTNLPVGSNSITATYNGDAVSGKSTSPVLVQVVN